MYYSLAIAKLVNDKLQLEQMSWNGPTNLLSMLWSYTSSFWQAEAQAYLWKVGNVLSLRQNETPVEEKWMGHLRGRLKELSHKIRTRPDSFYCARLKNSSPSNYWQS